MRESVEQSPCTRRPAVLVPGGRQPQHPRWRRCEPARRADLVQLARARALRRPGLRDPGGRQGIWPCPPWRTASACCRDVGRQVRTSDVVESCCVGSGAEDARGDVRGTHYDVELRWRAQLALACDVAELALAGALIDSIWQLIVFAARCSCVRVIRWHASPSAGPGACEPRLIGASNTRAGPTVVGDPRHERPSTDGGHRPWRGRSTGRCAVGTDRGCLVRRRWPVSGHRAVDVVAKGGLLVGRAESTRPS